MTPGATLSSLAARCAYHQIQGKESQNGQDKSHNLWTLTAEVTATPLWLKQVAGMEMPDACLISTRPRFPSPRFHKTRHGDICLGSCHFSTPDIEARRLPSQSHLQLHSKFEASLTYKRCCTQNKDGWQFTEALLFG